MRVGPAGARSFCYLSVGDLAQMLQDERICRESGVALTVARICEPVLDDLGFRLVRVRMTGGDRRAVLQIMAERPDGSMSIEDCESVSRAISPILDVEDIVKVSYALEVSSPGIDRPLVRASDFETWAGHEAKIELTEPMAERKRFRGVLEGFSNGEARIYLPPEKSGGESVLVGLPIEKIASAKLVLSDELLALARNRQKPGALGDGSEWSDEIEPERQVPEN